MGLLTIALLVVLAAATEPAAAASYQLRLSGCSQGSTSWRGFCSRAIDGNTNQNYWRHSCTHTGYRRRWWKATTKKPAHIKNIWIYNRLDCCSNRLNNFVITVDGQECASYRSTRSFSVKTFRCDKVGQEVMIRSRLRAPMSLCEVKVFGEYTK